MENMQNEEQAAAEGKCEVRTIDADKIRHVKEKLASDEVLRDIAETFKALGDPTRAKILHALSIEELCVCDLTSLLDVTESATSHQLRILRNLKLVKFRKKGKVAYYSLDDEHVTELLRMGIEHVIE